MSEQRRCERLDQASSYRLGELDAETARAFEGHLGGCAACRDELASQERAFELLALVAPEAEPPADLWSRLRARIGRAAPRDPTREQRHVGPGERSPARAAEASSGRPWLHWPSDPLGASLALHRGDEGVWEPTYVPGVEARRLFVDRAAGRATMLVRMAPGTSYPGHRHGGTEECFVLQGDLHVGDDVMHAGDYQVAGVGSRHGTQTTEGGCLLLIATSFEDRMEA